MSIKQKIQNFFKQASKLPAPAQPKKDFQLVGKDRRNASRVDRACRTLKLGTPSTGWMRILDQQNRAAKRGKVAFGDVVAIVEEMKAAGRDNLARHVHPRHLRAAQA